MALGIYSRVRLANDLLVLYSHTINILVRNIALSKSAVAAAAAAIFNQINII